MNNKIDRTVSALCSEIDALEELVSFWKEKYEEVKAEKAQIEGDNWQRLQHDLGNAFRFTMAVEENENGDLIIRKDKREFVANSID